MEFLLALAVIIAVIIFGALISLGNERQRRAIDELREQVVLWAIQDLRIKREHLIQEVRVDDPIEWLNRIAKRIVGFDLQLKVLESFEEPFALICSTQDGNRQVFFSPQSPMSLHKMKKEKRNRLSQSIVHNPILDFSNNATVFEISSLNIGLSFTLELPLAWNSLTGKELIQTERLWMYMIK